MSKSRWNDITREKVGVCTDLIRRGTLEASTSACFIVRVLVSLIRREVLKSVRPNPFHLQNNCSKLTETCEDDEPPN